MIPNIQDTDTSSQVSYVKHISCGGNYFSVNILRFNTVKDFPRQLRQGGLISHVNLHSTQIQSIEKSDLLHKAFVTHLNLSS